MPRRPESIFTMIIGESLCQEFSPLEVFQDSSDKLSARTLTVRWNIVSGFVFQEILRYNPK